jgi:uncharacterized OsmC-like protein
MTGEELRALQAPLKDRYKDQPETARFILRAEGTIEPATLSCHVRAGYGPTVEAGLHPAAGGDGHWACSGDMLLQSLVACAGVTLSVVATALGIPLRGGRVVAEGDLDFRGTLGVSRDVPVGFQAIRLRFDLDADATEEQTEKLRQLTERYCVVAQSLKSPPVCSITLAAG